MSHLPRPEDAEAGKSQPAAGERSELVAELQQLGQQLESTFRAFVTGPGQTIRREVSEAFEELGTQVQRAVHAIQQRPEASELEQKARRALQQVGEKPIVREVEETLVGGIQQLNLQLRKLVDRIERQPASGEQPQAATTQRLVIEDESGAVTGSVDDQPQAATTQSLVIEDESGAVMGSVDDQLQAATTQSLVIEDESGAVTGSVDDQPQAKM